MQNFQLIWQFKKANGSASSFRKCIFIKACYGQSAEGLVFWQSVDIHKLIQLSKLSIHP